MTDHLKSPMPQLQLITMAFRLLLTGAQPLTTGDRAARR